MERINTRKNKQHITDQHVTDLLINPLIFISFCYRGRVHNNKEFCHGNSKLCPEAQDTNSNSTKYEFLLKYVSRKNLE